MGRSCATDISRARSATARSRSTSATLAPSLPKAAAIARPMPLAAPTTTATSSTSCRSIAASIAWERIERQGAAGGGGGGGASAFRLSNRRRFLGEACRFATLGDRAGRLPQLHGAHPAEVGQIDQGLDRGHCPLDRVLEQQDLGHPAADGVERLHGGLELMGEVGRGLERFG